MRPRVTVLAAPVVVHLALASCGGAQRGAQMNARPGEVMAQTQGGAEDAFGPLEVGADYATTMTRVNREPFVSPTHGRRWVNVYVNRVGLEAYQRGAELPVGAVVVKESFEDAGGRPDTSQRGPLFVMERRAAGSAPDRGDFWYAIHWERPTGPRGRQPNGEPLPPIYWRGRSARVQYCEDCHRDYDHRMGGVPDDQQAWRTQGDAGASD